jgi:hypothetical protein
MARIVEIIEVGRNRQEPPAGNGGTHFGEGGIRLFAIALKVFLVVLGVVVIGQVLPAYYRHNEFESFLKQQAGSPLTADQLKQHLVAKAGELSVPLEEEDIQVQTVERTFRVAVDYTVPLNLIFYRQDLKFHSLASGWLPK